MRRTLSSAAIAAALAVVCGTHQAEAAESALELLKDCRSGDGRRAASCIGSVTGVASAAVTLGTWNDGARFVCPPEGSRITGEQQVRIFTQYADEHPEELHLHAASVVLYALAEAFPCPRNLEAEIGAFFDKKLEECPGLLAECRERLTPLERSGASLDPVMTAAIEQETPECAKSLAICGDNLARCEDSYQALEELYEADG